MGLLGTNFSEIRMGVPDHPATECMIWRQTRPGQSTCLGHVTHASGVQGTIMTCGYRITTREKKIWMEGRWPHALVVSYQKTVTIAAWMYLFMDNKNMIKKEKKEWEFDHFHSRKCIWNCLLPKWRPFCPGGDELKTGHQDSSPQQWASYQIRKIAVCACARNAGNVSLHRRFRRKPLVSDPGMHHGTCVTHVPWCMSGSLTCGGGENVPGIPGACAPAILRIWQEAHGCQATCPNQPIAFQSVSPYTHNQFLLQLPLMNWDEPR